MPVTAVVGAQWGDEGKGRVVDYLGGKADMVIRFQGGDNAGHTVINHHGLFKLHITPAGIFNPDTKCIVGAGTAVNPKNALVEIQELTDAGVPVENLWFDVRAHLVMPYHPQLDGLEEIARAKDGSVIGTTKRGIGPCYADKSARMGLRLGDLLRPDYLRKRIDTVLGAKNRTLQFFGAEPIDPDALHAELLAVTEVFGRRIVDTLPMIRAAYESDERILLEGQLGIMRDIDWGIYPYVTSSNPTAGGVFSGAGLPPQALSGVIGVVKAYSTAVGAGPFTTELFDEAGQKLRDVGKEYGATTGRPRRCGWFDGVAIKHAAWLNGFTKLAVTKLDVLDDFDELKICTHYEIDGERVTDFPDTPDLERATPIYETWKGWNSPTTEAKTWEQLPEGCRVYLERISELAGVPIQFVSVGPERDSLVVV